MAICAVYFRFTWNMRDGSEFPMLEAGATLLLTFGGVVRLMLPESYQCKILHWKQLELGFGLYDQRSQNPVGRGILWLEVQLSCLALS